MYKRKIVSTTHDRELIKAVNYQFISKLTEDEREAFIRCELDGLAEKRYVGVSAMKGDYQVKYLVNA